MLAIIIRGMAGTGPYLVFEMRWLLDAGWLVIALCSALVQVDARCRRKLDQGIIEPNTGRQLGSVLWFSAALFGKCMVVLLYARLSRAETAPSGSLGKYYEGLAWSSF